MGNSPDPNLQAAEEARAAALHVLATAPTIDELVKGVGEVYSARRPRHGHEAAQLLNFLEFKDPAKVVDVDHALVRAALERIAKSDPGDARVAEYLKLLG